MCMLNRENRAMVWSSFVTLSHCPLCQLHRCNSIADTAKKKKEKGRTISITWKSNDPLSPFNMGSFWCSVVDPPRVTEYRHFVPLLYIFALFFPIEPRAVHVSRTVFNSSREKERIVDAKFFILIHDNICWISKMAIERKIWIYLRLISRLIISRGGTMKANCEWDLSRYEDW